MAIVVRDVAQDDLVALMPIWEEIQAENYGLNVDALIARIELSLSQNGFRLVVAWDGKEAVGLASISLSDIGTWSEAPAIQVSGLHVLSTSRHRGVAKGILNAALASAESWGCNAIVASVPPLSREANRFFARLGFAPVSTFRVADAGSLRRKISAQPRRVTVARMRRRTADASPASTLRHAVGK